MVDHHDSTHVRRQNQKIRSLTAEWGYPVTEKGIASDPGSSKRASLGNTKGIRRVHFACKGWRQVRGYRRSVRVRAVELTEVSLLVCRRLSICYWLC